MPLTLTELDNCATTDITQGHTSTLKEQNPCRICYSTLWIETERVTKYETGEICWVTQIRCAGCHCNPIADDDGYDPGDESELDRACYTDLKDLIDYFHHSWSIQHKGYADLHDSKAKAQYYKNLAGYLKHHTADASRVDACLDIILEERGLIHY